MVSGVDPVVLERERAYLVSLDAKPLPGRAWGYLKLSGPGWVQSALTLGGGSGSTSLFAGALAGYGLLWVQPTSMFFGTIMLGAIGYITMCTGRRPFEVVNKYAHPLLGWGWALGTLVANFVWIFGQFSVSASVIGDMFTTGRSTFPGYAVRIGKALGETGTTDAEAAGMFYGAATAPVIALVTLLVAWHYGKGSRGVRWFEAAMKLLVAGIVICFAVVVFRTETDWGGVARGLVNFHLPRDPAQFDVVIGMFAAAVGINMTFLFPYTVLARGWGREHRALAKVDLGAGMLLPFAIATGFLVISSANELHPEYEARVSAVQADTSLTVAQQQEAVGEIQKEMRSAVRMSKSLESVFGRWSSHFIFGLGFLGMTSSSIVTMMLVSGFVLSEVCGGQRGGRAYKIGLAIPALGLLAPLVFGSMQMWLMVPISVFCFFFIPIAYITFFVLMNNRRLLGDNMPRGLSRWLWNTGMVSAIVCVVVGGGYSLHKQLNKLQRPAAASQVGEPDESDSNET